MSQYLLAAAIVLVATGALHSWLGERYILVRLFRRSDLPRLFGSDVFTKRTLRFAWHLTSIAWWGLAAILLLFAMQPQMEPTNWNTVAVIRWTLLASAVLALIASRGRHLSWVAFGIVAACLWLAVP
ncbi:MAG: hypothetical protein OEM23_00700 [Gemmatimonadota bacterium]|nr:hypothetical protein [Gemmatimonadota bacterium]MDH3426927.1 hypothetical protein [Gemmatimonadota bacterium]